MTQSLAKSWPSKICTWFMSKISCVRKAKARRNGFLNRAHVQVELFCFCFRGRFSQPVVTSVNTATGKWINSLFNLAVTSALYSLLEETRARSSLPNDSETFAIWPRWKLINGGKSCLVTHAHLSWYFCHITTSNITCLEICPAIGTLGLVPASSAISCA